MENMKEPNNILEDINIDTLSQFQDNPAIHVDNSDVELTKENCSPELWEQLGGNRQDVDDKDLPF